MEFSLPRLTQHSPTDYCKRLAPKRRKGCRLATGQYQPQARRCLLSDRRSGEVNVVTKEISSTRNQQHKTAQNSNAKKSPTVKERVRRATLVRRSHRH